MSATATTEPTTLNRGRTPMTLLAERAAWLPVQQLLLVADLHLGKAATFRRLGVPVPHGTTRANLDRLSLLMQRHGARGVVFLGDFLHSVHAHAATTLGELKDWRERHPHVSLTLVRGNHDRHAGDPPAWMRIACVEEPWRLEGTSLALCHHPQAVVDACVVAGHLHPGVVVRQGFERLRLPCFHATDAGVLLPAFGEFTGMHPIDREAGDSVYAVAGSQLMRVA